MAIALAAGAAQTKDTQVNSFTLTVARNSTIKIASRANFSTSCEVTSLPSYLISQNPKLGKFFVEPGMVRIDHVGTPSRNQCLGKSLRGVFLKYTAGPRKGTDHFTYFREDDTEKYVFEATVQIN